MTLLNHKKFYEKQQKLLKILHVKQLIYVPQTHQHLKTQSPTLKV